MRRRTTGSIWDNFKIWVTRNVLDPAHGGRHNAILQCLSNVGDGEGALHLVLAVTVSVLLGSNCTLFAEESLCRSSRDKLLRFAAQLHPDLPTFVCGVTRAHTEDFEPPRSARWRK